MNIYETLLVILEEKINLLKEENNKLEIERENIYSEYLNTINEEFISERNISAILEEQKGTKKQYIKWSIIIFALLSIITILFSYLKSLMCGMHLLSNHAFVFFSKITVSLGAIMASLGTGCYFLNTRELRNQIKLINERQDKDSKNILLCQGKSKIYTDRINDHNQKIDENKKMIDYYQRIKNYLEENRNNENIDEFIKKLIADLESVCLEKTTPEKVEFPVTDYMLESQTSEKSGFMLTKTRQQLKEE